MVTAPGFPGVATPLKGETDRKFAPEALVVTLKLRVPERLRIEIVCGGGSCPGGTDGNVTVPVEEHRFPLQTEPGGTGGVTWTVLLTAALEQVNGPLLDGTFTVTVAVPGLTSKLAGTMASISVGEAVSLKILSVVPFQVTEVLMILSTTPSIAQVPCRPVPRILSVVAGLPAVMVLGMICVMVVGAVVPA
jgi:hypothetical protein